VVNARARAEVLAGAAQGRLGTMLELTTQVNEGTFGRAQAYASRLEQMTTITPGELTISATVLGRWRFEPVAR
jgi:uncharacterized protein YggE